MSALKEPTAGQAGARRRSVFGAAAVVGLVVVGSSVLSLQGGSGATASAGAVVSSSSASPSPSVSPSTFPSPSGSVTPPPTDYTPLPPYPTPTGTKPSGPDPVVAPGTFGWLPGWVADVSTATGRSLVSVSDGVEAPTRRVVTLELFPAGLTPEGYDYPGRTETAPVNGHRAYLGQIPFGNTPDQVLMWQTDGGRWASLRASRLSAVDLEDLPRIAGAVLFKDTVTPLPVRVPKVPGHPELESVWLSAPVHGQSGYWSFQARWSASRGAVSLSVESMVPHGTPTPGSTPTAQPSMPGSVCREDRGVRACVYSMGEPGALPSAHALKAWLDRVELLGQDQGSWTTQAFE